MKRKNLLTSVPLLPVLIVSLLASSLMSSRSHAQQHTSARQLQQVGALFRAQNAGAMVTVRQKFKDSLVRRDGKWLIEKSEVTTLK